MESFIKAPSVGIQNTSYSMCVYLSMREAMICAVKINLACFIDVKRSDDE